MRIKQLKLLRFLPTPLAVRLSTLETRRRPLRATVDTPRCSLPPLPCAQLSRGGSTAAAGGGEEGSGGGDDGEVLPGVLS